MGGSDLCTLLDGIRVGRLVGELQFKGLPWGPPHHPAVHPDVGLAVEIEGLHWEDNQQLFLVWLGSCKLHVDFYANPAADDGCGVKRNRPTESAFALPSRRG